VSKEATKTRFPTVQHFNILDTLGNDNVKTRLVSCYRWRFAGKISSHCQTLYYILENNKKKKNYKTMRSRISGEQFHAFIRLTDGKYYGYPFVVIAEHIIPFTIKWSAAVISTVFCMKFHNKSTWSPVNKTVVSSSAEATTHHIILPG